MTTIPFSKPTSGPAAGAGPAESERSPFARLTDLLAGHAPSQPLINLSVGEPQHTQPEFVGRVLAEHVAEFGRYPLSKGILPFRAAAAAWLSRRFSLRAIDPETEVLVLNGSREGLFFAAIAAARMIDKPHGAILLPNPFYPAYAAGIRAAGCEPIYLATTRENGFLPDLDTLDEATLEHTVAFYLASPANPQGAVATKDYFARVHALAEKYNFIVLSDECYSEIYTRTAPGSMLASAGPDFRNVVAFQSLSKRSNLPGLRVGFVAGDKQFLARFHELRNVAAPQVPVPLQHVAIAAYGDEAHVEENRRLYGIKFDLADKILGSRFGYRRPDGGFCLWLDVSAYGGDERAALDLFRNGGVRVVPGSYLARAMPDGSNPGAGYIRVAMVQNSEVTEEALHRMVRVLESKSSD
ncbi:MAG TPA: aminotransferase class I/II-fold pyridoxal phosphate-dependent enzyme [Xanthobacteraceae bacterium]|nr:aminotransferase class I/II-fold pyridoxal phosphate-dependent enzyme [Xanthobacteraceae bacterium]